MIQLLTSNVLSPNSLETYGKNCHRVGEKVLSGVGALAQDGKKGVLSSLRKVYNSCLNMISKSRGFFPRGEKTANQSTVFNLKGVSEPSDFKHLSAKSVEDICKATISSMKSDHEKMNGMFRVTPSNDEKEMLKNMLEAGKLPEKISGGEVSLILVSHLVKKLCSELFSERQLTVEDVNKLAGTEDKNNEALVLSKYISDDKEPSENDMKTVAIFSLFNVYRDISIADQGGKDSQDKNYNEDTLLVCLLPNFFDLSSAQLAQNRGDDFEAVAIKEKSFTALKTVLNTFSLPHLSQVTS